MINLGNKRGGSHGTNLNGRGSILTPNTRLINDKIVGHGEGVSGDGIMLKYGRTVKNG